MVDRTLLVKACCSMLVAMTSRLCQEPEVQGESPVEARLLFEETFGGENGWQGWTQAVGASSGPGPESFLSQVEGTLCLTVGPETTRWLALQRTLTIENVAWLRVSARMRTQAVERAGARFANCNLYFRLGNGALMGTPILFGTEDWTQVARRIEVPGAGQLGPTTLTIGCFLSMPGSAFFDDVRVEAVSAPNWSSTAHGHFIYHVLPGDPISEEALAYNEESFALVEQFVGGASRAPVHFYKYPDRSLKAELTGDSGNAFARPEARELHSLWERDRHEIVHILALPIGNPPALLAEGLAVHLSGGWQGRPVADFAADVAREGRWIALGSLLETAHFRAFPDLITYAEAGAFVGWLIEQHGREKFLEVYRALDNSRPGTANAQALAQLLGSPLDELDLGLRQSFER